MIGDWVDVSGHRENKGAGKMCSDYSFFVFYGKAKHVSPTRGFQTNVCKSILYSRNSEYQ